MPKKSMCKNVYQKLKIAICWDRGITFVRKVSNFVAVYMVQRPGRLESLASYTAARKLIYCIKFSKDLQDTVHFLQGRGLYGTWP
jgi:hypothetical protein